MRTCTAEVDCFRAKVPLISSCFRFRDRPVVASLPRDFTRALIPMAHARQIALLLLALTCSCAGFRAPAAAVRARGRRSPAARGRSRWMRTSTRRLPRPTPASDGSAGLRQLLGLKGASAADRDAPFNWKIRLQLMKPATWVPLIWGVACGAAASGNYHAIWNLFGDAPTTDSWGVVAEDTFKALGAMLLSGPLLCGFTQTCNDWFDKDLDAINEPYPLAL